MSTVTHVPEPRNEPQRHYAPGTTERHTLLAKLSELSENSPILLTQTIGGVHEFADGEKTDVVQPHNHSVVLGHLGNATPREVHAAIEASTDVSSVWREMPFAQRAAIFLKAADLLAGPWRDTINAATMLGQSKTCYQAEIDAACELIDFLRFNVAYAAKILGEHPDSPPGTWNRYDFRPLEGFVLAITPFNFTAIAGNLPTAPALMGNTVLWKPSPTQQLAAHYFMRLLHEAGLPNGVINMLTGDGKAVSKVALPHADLAGVHFTGSTRTFRHLWSSVAENLPVYRNYPRIVGETGGKDFIVAHPSADVDALRVAMIRGAYEYQGQKCSAASRAYVPRSVWERMRDDLLSEIESVQYGDVSDFSFFGGAVIDRRSYTKLEGVLSQLRDDPACTILAGGGCDDSVGYFVQPTLVQVTDPEHESMQVEYFGPILSVYVYEDSEFEEIVGLASNTSPYALTGAIFAQDRGAVAHALAGLRFAAGNFYVNDKPTGSVVGQQPFGGARASGTNDKAGSPFNLARWISPRVIKESFIPSHDWRYPHQT